MLRVIALMGCVISTTLPLRAAELLPPNQPIEKVIDHYIQRKLETDKIIPAAQIDDANLIRRITLDLVGRIPTVSETRNFLESKEPDKRVKLVERLIASPGFVRHQTNLFDSMMNPYGSRNSGLKEYFTRALSENRSWDQIFRELIVPSEGDDPVNKSAVNFLKNRINDTDKLTNDVSVLFFGVNVSCAQCHNHPLVADWKQDHYYGMKAFFNRTVDIGGVIGEREFGIVKFAPPKGPERQAKMMFLTGNPIDDPGNREPTKEEAKTEKEEFEKAKKDKKPLPKPKFSAREKLVEVALKPGASDFLARNIVNRMRHRFIGYGLVMPLDAVHSENPPSHPELMTWLARDVATNGYDLKRLIRGIVLSETYSRSSQWHSEDELQPAPSTFAVGRVRALTPLQLTTSMKIALSDPKQFESAKPEELDKKFDQFERSASGFASKIPEADEETQIGVTEALLFSNSDRIHKELILDQKDSLLGISKIAKDHRASCELIVQSVLCRKGHPDEIKALTEYLDRRNDRLPEAYRQMLWSLVTSSEFRFNY